ncbi:hypothetical protein GWK47_054451 [Chionoecetes opilio]|uniref:Uncharacterized protein n=1 Tax=Chionoecetes opilio TaxID=41210 RepID=A0A8J5CQP1_CHIOP|nr:hypothetical protein GWK47_054451 [Chionoecetes opilio]
MAQYLQGLMEEGMGGVESLRQVAGALGTAAGPTCRHTTSPNALYTKPRHHTSHSAATLAKTRQHRPPPPPGPGGATVGMSPATFEAWATSVEDYSSICGWAAPTAAPYVPPFCNTEVQQPHRRAPGQASVQATLNHGGNRRCEKRGDGYTLYHRSVGGRAGASL